MDIEHKIYQDLDTGELHALGIDDDPSDIIKFSGLPKNLTANVIPKPSEAHYWKNGNWVLDSKIQSEMNRNNILIEIGKLECTITQRRIRDYLLGRDNGWLENVDNQIAVLRQQLNQI